MSAASSIKYEIQKANLKLDALKIQMDSLIDYIGQLPKKTEPKKEVKK
jgi:hypothetical protein